MKNQNSQLTFVKELHEADGESSEIPGDHRVNEFVVSHRFSVKKSRFCIPFVDHVLELPFYLRIFRNESHQNEISESKIDNWIENFENESTLNGLHM